MWDKIKSLFQKKKEQGYVSTLKFKDSIKALGMERYKNITIVYLSKPAKTVDPLLMKTEQPIYHFWRKQEEDMFFGEADTFEALQLLAREEIDNLI